MTLFHKHTIFLPATWLLFALLWPIGVTLAHPVSVTSAYIEIRERTISLEVEVLAEDLVMFYDLETDSSMHYPGEGLRTLAESHKAFVLKHLHVLDAEGRELPKRITDADLSEIPESGIYYDELMTYWMTYRIEFSFEGNPEVITLMQDFGGEDPAVPSEVTIQVFHKGVRIDSLMLEHGEFQAIALNWDQSWGNIADDPAAVRKAYAERKEELLGVTASANLYSFAYLERDGLRHDVLIPLNLLDEWVPLDRAEASRLTVEEQHALRGRLEAFFAEQNEVNFDGQPVEPQIKRLTFYGAKPSDYGAKPPEQTVPIIGGRLGVAYHFPAREPPRRMEFTWRAFGPVSSIDTRFFAPDSEAGVIQEIRSWDKSFSWEGDPGAAHTTTLAELPEPPEPQVVRIPAASVAVGGIGLLLFLSGCFPRLSRQRMLQGTAILGLSPFLWTVGQLEINRGVPQEAIPHQQAVTDIFATLQGNVYRAFERRDETAIYDALVESVAGPLLESFYLEVIRGLRMEDLGGGVSRVDTIEILETEVEAGESTPHASFTLAASWNVSGTLEHWGHIHSRTNRYRAQFHIEGLEEGWRITGFEPLNQKLVSLKVRVRN